MTSNDDDIPVDVALEILLTKKRPVVVINEQDDLGPLHLERIFVERVELAKNREKIASESETLLYLTQKTKSEPDDVRVPRFVFYLFDRWTRKYLPEYLPANKKPSVLDEIELLELKNIRIWLYEESIRLMDAGVITPGLDSIV